MRGQRVGVQQHERSRLAAGERRSDLGRAAPGSLGEARTGVRKHANLTKPTPVRAGRDLEQTGSRNAGQIESRGNREKSINGLLATRPLREPLTPDDDDRSSAPKRRGKAANRVRVSARTISENGNSLRGAV